jgi:hypothetical protein
MLESRVPSENHNVEPVPATTDDKKENGFEISCIYQKYSMFQEAPLLVVFAIETLCVYIP